MESAKRVYYRTGEAEGVSKSKKDIAKNMLVIGMDIDTISKATGLSIDDIQTIGVRE